MNAAEAFQRAYNGSPNFMTPTIVWAKRQGDYFVELSTGRGMYEQPIWGATFLDLDGGKLNDLSAGVFESEADALEYIREALETDSEPYSYRGTTYTDSLYVGTVDGFDLYRRVDEETGIEIFDVVQDGDVATMMAGINGAKRWIELQAV